VEMAAGAGGKRAGVGLVVAVKRAVERAKVSLAVERAGVGLVVGEEAGKAAEWAGVREAADLAVGGRGSVVQAELKVDWVAKAVERRSRIWVGR